MPRSALAFALPCSRCGAGSGDPCVRRDGGPAAKSHMSRTPLAPCGTYAAYQRHRKKGEPACDECLEANRLWREQYRQRRPDVRDQDIALLRARREATRLLIERHRAEFRQLLEEVAS